MNQLVTTSRNALAVIHDTSNVPSLVTNGIVDLMLAFPAGPTLSADQYVRKGQLFAKAVVGFEQAVVEHALEHLLLHNPRNPFAPTAQDLFEACRETRARWKGALLRRYLGSSPYRPFVPDMPVPEVMAARLMHEGLSNLLPREFEELLRLSDKQFDSIPRSYFPENVYERAVDERTEAAERAAARGRRHLVEQPQQSMNGGIN